MDPTYIRKEPGKSPMGMDLIPVYEDEDGVDDSGAVRISPVVEQNIGVRTAKVRVREITKKIRTVGNVTYDERRVTNIQTKTSGWVEKLYIDFTGQEVKKGDYLLDLYSPELVATQEEYLLALSYRDSMAESPIEDVAKGGESLLEASRRRLELFDVPEHQLREIEKSRKIKKTLHIHSPVDGIVVKKNVVAGMQVKPGMNLYMIADLSNVWVLADIYEYEIPWVKMGQRATMTLAARPGKVFRGKVTYIYPFMEKKTRTVRVRMEFNNPGLHIKPDMYANVEIMSRVKRKGLSVPLEAVIHSGSRNIVIIAKGEGRFRPVEVTLGVEGDGYYEILEGLREGETVVTSSNFLLDSESNLKEAINKMLEPEKPAVKTEHAAMERSKAEQANSDAGETDNSGMDHSK
jgi:multidrug efflux pump subunit AcrA (membrane-fusion protein)